MPPASAANSINTARAGATWLSGAKRMAYSTMMSLSGPGTSAKTSALFALRSASKGCNCQGNEAFGTCYTANSIEAAFAESVVHECGRFVGGWWLMFRWGLFCRAALIRPSLLG